MAALDLEAFELLRSPIGPRRAGSDRLNSCGTVDVATQLEQAAHYYRSGDRLHAEQLCRQVLLAEPGHADAHHLIGLLAWQRGQYATAVDHITRAIAARPSAASLYNSLALACQGLGRIDEAVDCLLLGIRIDPSVVELHNNLGNIRKKQGRLDEAILCYQRALRLDPRYALAHNNLAMAQKDQGLLEAAETSCRRAIELKADFAEAFNNLGSTLAAQGKIDEALEAYHRATQIQPRLREAYNNAGRALADLGRIGEAGVQYRQALRIGSSSDLAWLRLKSLCPVIPQSEEEIEQYRHRLETVVDEYADRTLPIAMEEIASCAAEPPFYLAYQGRNDRELKSRLGRLFARSLGHPTPPSRPNGKPHLGFVVTSGHESVFVRFMAGMLNQLFDPDLRVSVVCSEPGVKHITPSLRDQAIEFLALPTSFPLAVEAIRAAQFDLLFYFEVGTDSVSYFLPFFSLAPVQCTSWGFPVTTGVPELGFFISSTWLEPEDGPQHYTEQLVQLDTLPVFYMRPTMPMIVGSREQFGFPDDDHVYLCPHSLFKLQPQFDEVLAGILRADGQGKVFLLEGKHSHWSLLLKRRFERNLPDVAKRIVFLPKQNHEGFVRLLASADVLLDPFPFGGGATSYEAFGVGTPVVTLPGEFMRGRVTAACYAKMELLDPVAHSLEDYISRAIRIAGDSDYRHELRSQILARNDALYEDRRSVDAIRDFCTSAIIRARTA